MTAVSDANQHRELVALLRRLAEQAGIGVEDARINALADEAMRRWPGPPDEAWWRWLQESCTSLGIRAKVVDLSLDNAWDLVQDSAWVTTYAGTGRLVTLTGIRGNRAYAFSSEGGFPPQGMKRSVLTEMLGVRADHQDRSSCRWVVVERSQRMEPETHHGNKHMSPLRRLLGILEPEWHDIWIVMVFAFMVGLLAMTIPIAVEALVNTVAFGRFLQPVFILSLILFVFLAFGAAIRGLQAYVVEILQRRLFVRVAADLAYRLPRVQRSAFDAHYGPELVNRFFDVVTLQKVCAGLLMDAVALALTAFIGMAVLAFYHPWLLAFDVILLALVGSSIWVLGRGGVASAIEESKYKYQVGAWLEEIARCQIAFKCDGGAEFASDRTNHLVGNYLRSRARHFRVFFRQLAFVLGIQVIGATVLLGFGGWLVIRGQLTLGQLVAAELIVTIIFGALASMGKHIESFYDLLAGVDKLGHLFDLPLEREDGLLTVDEGKGAAVTLRDVSFRFSNRSAKLQSLSLRIAAGERVGLTGSTGSGKSTLLDLLYGLRRPEVGHLEIDRTDPRDVRPDILRSHVALVRTIEIFEGSVADNILLGRHELTVSDAREVLQRLGLLEEILAFHDGLSTRLQSSGAPLTGSQMRLLMLARAMVAQPRLLLIDGVLDGLSDATLQRVLPAVFPAKREATLVVVSGRRAVLQMCDRIIQPTGVDVDVAAYRDPASPSYLMGPNRKLDEVDYDYY